MENWISLLISAVTAIILIRALFAPICFVWKLILHAGCGFACLWLLNTAAFLTGIRFPVNAVTILLAGFLGFPGIGLMALLEWMT